MGRRHAGLAAFAPAALAEVGADDVIQGQGLGEAADIHRQAHGEFLGQPFVERTQAAVGLHAQQVGPAVNGAVTHPGGAGEKECYADS